MSETRDVPSGASIENARVGYQAAIDLTCVFGGYIWSVHNAMIVANSIIVAGITVLLGGARSLPVLGMLLPLAGLLLCVAWLLHAVRAHGLATYYMLSARELEERYLAGEVHTVSRGGRFADGEAVTLTVSGAEAVRRISRLPQRTRAQWLAYMFIAVFVAMYIGALVELWM